MPIHGSCPQPFLAILLAAAVMLLLSSSCCVPGKAQLTIFGMRRGTKRHVGLFSGEGVTTDLAIAHDLYKRAAELGDPDAQADMAVRLALGLRPMTGLGPQQYGLTSPDVPAALLNYFFAAAGNDSFAQMALGYRHMYGVDVPQSCPAGLLYYNPVAEQVIEAARYPGQLPQVLISTHRSACHMQGIWCCAMQAAATAAAAQSHQIMQKMCGDTGS